MQFYRVNDVISIVHESFNRSCTCSYTATSAIFPRLVGAPASTCQFREGRIHLNVESCIAISYRPFYPRHCCILFKTAADLCQAHCIDARDHLTIHTNLVIRATIVRVPSEKRRELCRLTERKERVVSV